MLKWAAVFAHSNQNKKMGKVEKQEKYQPAQQLLLEQEAAAFCLADVMEYFLKEGKSVLNPLYRGEASRQEQMLTCYSPSLP